MNIRYGSADDAALLSELGARTFREAYVGQIDQGQIDAYVRTSFSLAIQSAELSQPKSVFLIAEVNSIPAGYAKLGMNNHAEAVKGMKPVEIERIYLLQEFVGLGAGSKLMEQCIREAKQRGCNILWLCVWENNQRAIRFYRKWGFQEVGVQAFKLGRELQQDLIMVLRV